MKYRRLGQTDIEVSTVCLGCWALIGGRTWGRQDRADSVATVHAALDAGVSFFDTAPAYGGGESEALLGEALAGHRDEVVIATKVSRGQVRADDVRESCEQSLRLLKTDHVDLLQVHWPNPDVPLDETFGALAALQAAGMTRAVGVSNFGASFLRELLPGHRIESNQLCYSLLWRPIEHEARPLCVANDVSILCYSPLCQGLLTGKFAGADDVPSGRARTRLFSKDRPESRHGEPGCEDAAFEALARIRQIAESIGEPMGRVAMAWLLAQEGVASVLAGARNAAQAAENARAAELELSADALGQLDEATQAVKAYAGTNGDMWQSDSRMERPDRDWPKLRS